MSLTRSLSILRSLSPKLLRYSRFYCYERFSSSSDGVDDPRPGDWRALLSEEKFKRKFDDFTSEFKELGDRINSIQTTQPITPDWEFEKQSEKFLSDYKQIKDESLQNSGMQPIVLKSGVDEPPPAELEKQWEDIGLFLKASMDRTRRIVFEINFEMRYLALNYFRIIRKMSTSDNMKGLKNSLNVLKDLYCKLGKSIQEHPDEYFRFHDECSATTQKVISVLVFVHWMENGSLLVKSTTAKKMGFEPPEFDLDLEDYFIGLCIMSNDLVKYASNLHLSKDYDSLRSIAAFMINMEETLGMLFLSNDKLRKRMEGLRHNVSRVRDMSVAGF